MPEVVVIGGANVDIKGRAAARLVPGTSNPGAVIVSPGGVGRNIAENLARLGVDTALVTCVGADPHGELIRSATAAAGVDMTMTTTVNTPTGVYLAILDSTGEMATAVGDMRASDSLGPERLIPHAAILAAARLLVADCNLPVASLSWLSRLASQAGIPLLVEPISVTKAQKILEIEPRRGVTYITPNRQQIEALTGISAIVPAARSLWDRGFRSLFVHAGGEGAYVCEPAAEPAHVSAFAVEPIADVTGAGDAAVAGIVFGLVSGFAAVEAARLGQAAAAVKLASPATVAAALSRDRILVMTGLARGRP